MARLLVPAAPTHKMGGPPCDDMLWVTLTDGRIIAAPLVWFPILSSATPEQQSRYEILGGGIALHWPDIDEDLSIAGLLAGAEVQSM